MIKIEVTQVVVNKTKPIDLEAGQIFGYGDKSVMDEVWMRTLKGAVLIYKRGGASVTEELGQDADEREIKAWVTPDRIFETAKLVLT